MGKETFLTRVGLWIKKSFTSDSSRLDNNRDLPPSAEDKSTSPSLEDIKNELRGIVHNVSSVTSEELLNRVKAIEHYLALDDIALQASTIDYSFVKNKEIRAKLESDHITMWRCRLGLRTINPEFNEFCLYVQMQVEALLLYYYNKMFNNDKHAIIQHLNDANPKAKYPYTKVQYSGMLYAFCNEHSIHKDKIKGKHPITTDILDTVRELRNSIVHSSKTIELPGKFVSQVLASAKSSGITLYDFIIPDVIIHAKAVFDFNTIICGDPNKFSECKGINISTFNNSIKLKILKEHKPFDAIIIDLKKWVTAIQSELSNVK